MSLHHHTPMQAIDAAQQIDSATKVILSDTAVSNNHCSVPAIRVNHQTIAGEKISAEMQYHPAASQREAMLKAAEALIIGELLRQRAAELSLNICGDNTLASDDDFIEALLAAEVVRPVATDAECAQYYHANAGRFITSPLLELQHILLASAADDDEGRIAGKARAKMLISALQDGADFAVLASEESACPSREMGGSLGQISRGQTVPEFERQVFAAEPGLMLHPLESRYGFHIASIAHKIPGRQLPYEAVKDRIADYLNEKVRAKAIAQYIQTLIARADIEGYQFDPVDSSLMQ